ncbi:MAG: HAMP domain-containing sensor histidine kinase, partial [Myxococcota bacterium]
ERIFALEEQNRGLRAEVRRLRDEVSREHRMASYAMNRCEAHATQLRSARQQNRELYRLAANMVRVKQAAEQKADEAAEHAQQKGTLLANFSHEIRAPLNGMIGYCDLLSREEGSRLTPTGLQDLHAIRRNAAVLLELINDILAISKIESGRVDIVKEWVDLARIAEECLAAVRKPVRNEVIALRAQVSSRARKVYSDGLKLRQIMLNLLSNAVKFTESGEVILHISAVDGALVIQVRDTGPGIPPEELDRIFEKFCRGRAANVQRHIGSGLGLAIVRELICLLQGEIDVESEVGTGTTFTVRVPQAFQERAEASGTLNPSTVIEEPFSAQPQTS